MPYPTSKWDKSVSHDYLSFCQHSNSNIVNIEIAIMHGSKHFVSWIWSLMAACQLRLYIIDEHSIQSLTSACVTPTLHNVSGLRSQLLPDSTEPES